MGEHRQKQFELLIRFVASLETGERLQGEITAFIKQLVSDAEIKVRIVDIAHLPRSNRDEDDEVPLQLSFDEIFDPGSDEHPCRS